MAEELTDLLELIQRFNYFAENYTNKTKHFSIKIQMYSILNFLANKPVGFLCCLGSINI